MKKTSIALAVVVAALGAVPAARQAPGAQALLEAARKAETVDGDLKAAIAQYEQIVKRFPNDRAVVADALVRMASAGTGSSATRRRRLSTSASCANTAIRPALSSCRTRSPWFIDVASGAVTLLVAAVDRDNLSSPSCRQMGTVSSSFAEPKNAPLSNAICRRARNGRPAPVTASGDSRSRPMASRLRRRGSGRWLAEPRCGRSRAAGGRPSPRDLPAARQRGRHF